MSYSFNGTAEIAAAVPGTPGGPPTMRLFQHQTVSCPGNRGPKGGPMADICGPNGAHWGTPSRTLNGSCIFEGSSGKSCLNPVRQWTPVSPKVVGDFSAICYLTARDVSRLHTGSRPIGLIESDWGGTPVQAWTPPAGLGACGLPLHSESPRLARAVDTAADSAADAGALILIASQIVPQNQMATALTIHPSFSTTWSSRLSGLASAQFSGTR